MPKKHAQHGGPRPGAGRPRMYKARGKISVVMEQSLIDRLADYANNHCVSISTAVQHAVEAWLKRRK